MRVLILHRPTGDPGGDMRSVRHLAQAMSEFTDVTLRPADEVEGEHDWAILYPGCSPDWGLPAAERAKAGCDKLAIVPNWYDRTKRLAYYGQPHVAPGYTEAVRATLQKADVWFTATMAEALDCWRLAGRKPVHVMGRGGALPEGVQRQPPEDYVVCLARLEPAKNQYTLALACEALGYPLVCVGSTANAQYAKAVNERGARLTRHVSHEEALDILSRARVHALVSFGEQGGNSHIEAGLLGVPSVLGRNPQEVEFFGNRGIYADPTDVGDIMDALKEAWQRPPGQWVDVPSWCAVAERTINYMKSNR